MATRDDYENDDMLDPDEAKPEDHGRPNSEDQGRFPEQ